jgi:YD repeat-containing protein
MLFFHIQNLSMILDLVTFHLNGSVLNIKIYYQSSLKMKKTMFLLNLVVLTLGYPIVAIAENRSEDSWHHYDPSTGTMKWKLSEGKEIEVKYDSSGRTLSRMHWTGTTQYKYDAFKQLKEVSAPQARTTKYVFRNDGALLAITSPSGECISYSYKPGRLLESVTVRGKEILFSYDHKRNLLIQKIFPNGVFTKYEYDAKRRIVDIDHSHAKKGLIAHFHFTYDDMDNRISMSKTTPKGDAVTEYKYDKLYRLKEAISSNGFFEKYTYSPIGDRLSKETPKGLISYSYKEDEIIVGDTLYSYDSSGNLVRKVSSKEAANYIYNELGQLIGYKDSKNTIGFTYNGQGERLSKTVNGKTTTYSYEHIFPVFQILEEKKEEKIKNYFYA